MFLSARHGPLQMEALKYVVIDKDTGEKIPHVVWANDKTGRYRQELVDNTGRLIVENGKVKSDYSPSQVTGLLGNIPRVCNPRLNMLIDAL